MDSILAAAGRAALPVIEDNAGLFGKYRGRWLGVRRGGDADFTKRRTSPAAGAARCWSTSPAAGARGILREGHGPQPVLPRRGGQVFLGGHRVSYLPSDLLAAFLLAQLENRRPSGEAARPMARLPGRPGGLGAARGGVLPVIPAHCESAYALFHLVLPSAEAGC